MEHTTTARNLDIASGLLDIVPRLLRRLRTDLPPMESLRQEPGGEDFVELRAAGGQITLLRILLEHQRCTMQEIAHQMAIMPSTATGMVKKLQAHGYIERLRHEEDWRVVSVQLTERGREAIALYDRFRLESLERRLARLDEEDLQHVRAALPALKKLIDIDL